MNKSQRAAQMWSLLAVAARNRQILTYENRQILTYDLMARATGVPRPAVGGFLGPIQKYCLREKLPPLNVLVVSEKSGMPGEGYIAAADIPQAQANVFAFDWLAQRAPSAEELAFAGTSTK